MGFVSARGAFIMTPLSTIYFIIFLEGYIVLSTELLAIRLLVPFTGSGTDTVSIIIAAVLMPLAFGYYAGGKFRKKTARHTVRGKLVLNLIISAFILTFGLSYVFLDQAFTSVQKTLGLYNRIWLTTLYSLLFVAYPVFLLGQTVPLISNYFSREKLSVIAGRILFFSTMGSFTGAIISTLVLMSFLGVHHTVSITIAAMAALVLILSKKKLSARTAFMAFSLIIALALNSSLAMNHLNIVSNNKYSTVQITDDGYGTRYLKLNRTAASAVYEGATDTVLDYALYIEDNFLGPIFTEGPKKSILILGAGGFTLGRMDTKNDYTYVDIDDALKGVAEELFLKERLTPNKKFAPMDARAFLIQSKDKYDFIMLDLFRDPVSAPENLSTMEFFQTVKDHLNPGGIVVGNFWASPTFTDTYSRALDKTLRAVFPMVNRQIINPYDAWKGENNWRNVIYSYVDVPNVEDDVALYTDNKNTIMFDKPATLPH